MGAICLALLLIVAVIGIDGLQPMTAHRSNADQHYLQKDAKVDNENDIAPRQERISCMYDWYYDLSFCIIEGCNPNRPRDYCFKYLHCEENRNICEQFRECVEDLPCFGPCYAS